MKFVIRGKEVDTTATRMKWRRRQQRMARWFVLCVQKFVVALLVSLVILALCLVVAIAFHDFSIAVRVVE